ncbi:hypothetical protein [Thalassotalea sp. Y01]|uniref:hypothetical protein n=1 Tax=Thalassotalea sp. Y01 TaxID=2729613 RepID=UPI00145E0526|nr:hypothetical protein [Thalassotalea sp. Y01]NMP14801.1 hypothetical protein [Thalassotalea sp. Y01]
MNKHSIAMFFGVIVAVLVILLINEFTIVDDCLDHGGRFDYQTGQCLLADAKVHVASFTNYLVALYFVLAIAIAFAGSRLTKKLFKL